jgi:peptidyl-prolyl cis-trans isomerase D
MLRGLRKASSNWLGKVVMAAVVGFLIISFGIWGINDIFRGFGNSTVIRVGRSEMTVDQFRSRYNEQMQAFGRRIGRPISPGLARTLGLDQRLLEQIVSDMALDERARQLRLGLSNDEIRNLLTSNPGFRGANGQFDQSVFLYRLRDAGYTEQRFVSEMRRDALRRQIEGAIAGGLTPPKVMAQADAQYRGEERSIDYVQLDGSKVGEIPAPTPEQLAAYFEEHKFAFQAPEFRKIQLLVVSQADIAATIEVSEEDAKRMYQERQARYGTPERRQVTQISFPNADDAKKASERIAGGLSFDDLAKEPEIATRVVDLGTIAKDDISRINPPVADAAFGLAEGAVSAPVTGRFGTVILRVSKIEPATTKPFAEVEADIKKDIASDRAKAEVNKIRDKIEEELGGSERLEDIAKKLSLKLVTIDAVDRYGKTPAGEQAAGVPGNEVISAAFGSDVGPGNDPVTLAAGGFVWYDVVSITPPRERSLDEVKDKVEASFREDETTKRLNAKTAELVGKLKSGASLAEVAAAAGLNVETKWGLKRRGTVMPARVIAAVFRTGKDQVGSADGEKPTERVIFRVTDIKVPAFEPDSAETATVIGQIKDAFSQDIIGQYLARVEKDIGTDINQRALAQATGQTPDESGGAGY